MERPILFSGPMVQAILEGRKTQTRRVVKPVDRLGDIKSITHADYHSVFGGDAWIAANGTTPPYLSTRIECPYGKKGDRLWVRETWRLFDAIKECECLETPCGCPKTGTPLYKASHDDGESKWKPSIHMPRAISRILLEITDIRAERLQDISEDDAVAEGAILDCSRDSERCALEYCKNEVSCPHITRIGGFRQRWDSINAKRGYGWAKNPWVWVVEFKLITQS